MTPDELIANIEKDAPGPIYFLYGEERFYHVEVLGALTRRLIDADNREFNLETFAAAAGRVEIWIGAANTVSFLGGRKLVIVRDLQDATLGEKDVEALLSYLKNPCPETCFVVTADKIDRKRKLYKALADLKTAVECVAPAEASLSGWLRRRAKLLGYELSGGAAGLMVDRIGAKPGMLAAELEKVASYAGEKKIVDENMVAELVGQIKMESAFALTDALKNKNVESAVRLLRNQLGHGEEALKILGAIIWQFRLIWEVKHCLKNRMSPAQIAQKIGAKPFVVEKATASAQRFTQRELRRGFESLFQADRELKTSAKSPESVLETLVIRLCSTG
jgi:DNA polymerase-3 subunit delta